MDISDSTSVVDSRFDDVKKILEKIPPDQKQETVNSVLRDLYKENLFSFAKYFLGYKDIVSHAHLEMIEALEAPTKRKLIVMPRGTFKSSIGVVAYSLWLLIRNPNERILIDSELYTNSRNFLREMKAHMMSQAWTSLFGKWEGPIWTESEMTVSTRTKSFKEASITASGVGATKVGQHYTVIIGDDYNSSNNSGTPEACQKIIDHYRLNQSILEPDGVYVVIGTRYSVLDLPGFILDNEIEVQDGLIQGF